MRAIVDHLILGTSAVIMGGPLLMVFLGAFSPGGLAAWIQGQGPSLGGLSENISTLSRILGEGRAAPTLGGMFATSMVVAGLVALLTTAVSLLAAFAMVFVVNRRERSLMLLLLLTLFFPIEARMLPTFDIVAGFGLTSTIAGLVLPILPLAVATFILRQHLRQLPRELMDAARLDGAHALRFLLDIVLPLSLIPIAAVLLITFVAGWSQYLWPLVASVDNRHVTLMRGLNLAGQGSGSSMVIASVSMLPPLVLVLGLLRLMSRTGWTRTLAFQA